MKNLIKTTAIALTLTATTASAAQVMVATSMDGNKITQTEEMTIDGTCREAIAFINITLSDLSGQRIKMTYFDTYDTVKVYKDKVAGIDYLAGCEE